MDKCIAIIPNKVKNTKFFEALKAYYGNNQAGLLGCFLQIADAKGFKDNFKKWYKKYKNLDKAPEFDDIDVNTFINDVDAYFKSQTLDGSKTVMQTESTGVTKHTSAGDRRGSIKDVATHLERVYAYHMNVAFDVKNFNQEKWCDLLTNHIAVKLLDTTAQLTGLSKADIQKRFNTARRNEKGTYYLKEIGLSKQRAGELSKYWEYYKVCQELLGDNLSKETINLMATLEEMLDYTTNSDGVVRRDAFFEEVLNLVSISKIRDNVELSTTDEEANKEASANDIADGMDKDEGWLPINLDIDESIKEFDSHGGEYPTFLMHISDSLRAYFDSLPRLRTPTMRNGEYDYDNSSPMGLSATMNAAECVTLLYSRAKTNTNINDFIESIRVIAETMPGCEGFIKLYYDLKGYNKTQISSTGGEELVEVQPMTAFAEELFRTFAKPIFAKREIYIDKKTGELKSRISNYMASRKDSFRIELLNDIKSSSLGVNYMLATDNFIVAKDLYTKINKNLNAGVVVVDGNTIEYTIDSLQYQADRADIIDKISKLFRLYYPNITLAALYNYISSNRTEDLKTKEYKVNELANINTLLSLLNNTIKSARITTENYNNKLERAASIKAENAQAREFAEIDENYDLEKHLKSTSDIYAEDHVSQETKAAAAAVADILLPYSVVKTQLNSRNAAGNNSSDVLNNNMLGYLKTVLEHEDNATGNSESPIKNFGKYKFRNRQYDFSTLLVEHRDANGKIINLGLFRKEVDAFGITRYIPTKYATSLMQISLFNGTADHVKSKSALYAQMSKGDYLVSALTSFHNSINQDGVEDMIMADFFLRTPSDAPKNFVLTLPRYRIGKLFNIANLDEIKEDAKVKLNSIAKTTDKQGITKSNGVNIEVFSNILLGNYDGRVYLNADKVKSSTKETEDGTYAIISHKDKNGIVTEAVIIGDLTNIKGTAYIDNIRLVGVVGEDNTNITGEVATNIENYYIDAISNNKMTLTNGNKVQRHIDRSHPIYQQFLNVVKQEISDAFYACDAMFERITRNDDGGEVFISGDTLEPIWKGIYAEAVANSQDPHNIAELNYHRDKSGKVFKKDSKGIVKLLGNVWKSDRFTKFSDVFEGNENVNANYFADLFADGIATEEDGKIHLLYGGHNTHVHINSNGEVELTEAQQAYIESRLDAFIIDYCDATQEEISKFSQLIEDNKIPDSYNDIAEFILNYRLAYYSCADLLEGDSKSYKSFVDFLKRAKEVQGAGIAYSSLNYTRVIHSSREKLKYSSLNIDTRIAKWNEEGWLHDCVAYSSFRGITVNNTVRTSEYSKKLINTLADSIYKTYTESGVSITKKQAEKRATEMMGHYKDTKTNDAQSYITFEEWIRRISMRGQLPKYMPLIEKIYDESKPLTADDINEFIQVQKNFYYDMYYDKHTNHMRSRQIKNAEFVLVPRFIRGTQLETVYNEMIKHGIDQLNTVETSKAGKANVQTLWDDEGNLSDKWFKAPATQIQNAIELYDYNFLYTQQETPQHMNSENKAAIQLMKKIVDNIPQYLNGKEHPLWKTKLEFQKLYAQNIKEANRDLFDKLNISYDKNGNFDISDENGVLNMDTKVFCRLLKNELIRQQEDAQLMDYVTLNTTPVENDGFGLDTKMPIIANNSIRLKFEYIAQALFNNNVTRQTLPGFHAAQITGIGWRSDNDVKYHLTRPTKAKELKQTISYQEWKNLNKKDRIRYTPENGIGTAEELQYHPAKYKHKTLGRIITEKDYLKLTEKEQQNYSLNSSATYIEIRVPKSVFNLQRLDKKGRVKTDEQLLQELEDAGLDEIIGYRIPTEGKQSMAIMKIVGFVDDSYGSTIVVPDDWVAQTGSDFDIDSIYTCVFNNYINQRTGRVEKVKYKTEFNEYDYIQYISRRLENFVSDKEKVKEAKAALVNRINETKQNAFVELMNTESELYDSLSKQVKKIIRKAQAESEEGVSKQEDFVLQKQNVINDLNTYLNEKEQSSDEYDKILAYIEITQELLTHATSDKYNQQIKEGLDKIQQEYVNEIEKKAKALNLPTYREYQKLTTIEKNGKHARSNKLIQDMIDILSSDWSLEENLSQSNFREVTGARDRLWKLVDAKAKIEKEARSPYDFIAQVNNQEEAISGRALKGIAVAYNNVVSICNSAHTRLTTDNAITVEYPLDKYDAKALMRRFNEYVVDEKGNEVLDAEGNPIVKKINVKVDKERGIISVRHTTFGWSNDNRTVSEFLITPYSSQTVAHQLDVIKEGAIPNVNQYTFSIYNLFPAIGSDYDTIIAFMMQPAITSIVDYYNRSKSIYSSRYVDPIKSATIALAKKLNPSIKYYGDAVDLLDNLVKSKEREKENPLNYSSLANRLKHSTANESDLIFDYLIIKKFIQLRGIAEKINAYSFVINPDKYGAKQTIFATNEVLLKIGTIEEADQVFEPVRNAKGDYVSFLDAIFPGISNVVTDGKIDSEALDYYLKNSDDDASINIPLHSFMKYSTVPSIIINRRLFQTQHPKFRNIIDSLTSVMSGRNPIKSEKTDNSFSNYVIAYLYNQIGIISRPVDYDIQTGIITPNENGNSIRERLRIYGFNYGANFRYKKGDSWYEFNPVDKSNPTEEEIAIFSKFSPAQKIKWLQQHASNSLVCEYLNVNLTAGNGFNVNNPNGQVIEFKEEGVDLTNARELLEQMFMNTNPFFRLAALDLIKYAYVVEGRVLRRNTVSKLIPNSILLKSRESGGTGIVDSLKQAWEQYIINQDDKLIEQLTENYIRSHQNMTEISQARVSTEENSRYFSGRAKVGSMINIFDNDNTHDFLVNKGIIYEEIDTKTGETETRANHYINITTTKNKKLVTILYKIIPGKLQNQYILVPLNTLEPNEFDTEKAGSANSDNNQYPVASFYENLINNWNSNGMTFKDYYSQNVTDELVERAKPKKQVIIQSTYVNTDFNIYGDTGAHEQLRQQIASHFVGLTDTPLYLKNAALKEYARKSKMKTGVDNGIPVQYKGQMYIIYRMSSNAFEDYKDSTTPVKEKDLFMKELIEDMRKYNDKDFTDVFCVSATTDVRNATVIEQPIVTRATQAQQAINRFASTGNQPALETARINATEGIEANENSVQRHLEGSLLNTRNWVKTEVEQLINGAPNRPGLNMFVLEPDTGRYLSMTDSKVFAMMLDNPAVHRAYLKTYLDALRLIETFDMFNYTSYADDQEQLKSYVDDIKKFINRLKENPVFKKAETLYVTEHLAKVSKNPNVQRNIISLLDGYHKTNFITANINDLQDTSNPIIQIITKRAMADIRAKELQMEHTIEEFEKYVNDIFDRAHQAGQDVDFDKFIGEDGKFIENYNAKFVEDYEQLKTNIKQTYFDYNTSTGNEYTKHKLFAKHLKAKHEFERFLLLHVNRELTDDYYQAMFDNVESMIKPNGEFYEVYVEYERLLDRKIALSKMSDSDGHLTDDIQAEINRIEDRLKNISSPIYIDEHGFIFEKEKDEEITLTGNAEQDQNTLINSYAQAEKLANFISIRNDIKDKYITIGEKDGFRELLDRYSEIVARYEQIDPVTGSPKYSPLDLEQKPEYNIAKNWLRQNATFKYGLTKKELDALSSDDVKSWLTKYYDGDITENDDDFKYVLASASKYFRNKKGANSNKHSIYKEIVKARNARDIDGVIDGTKLTEDDIRQIREEELKKHGLTDDNQHSERTIIHNSSQDNDVFKDSFYKGMLPLEGETKITTKEYMDIVRTLNDILRKAFIVEDKVLDTSLLSIEDLENILIEFKKLGYDEDTFEFNTDDGVKKSIGLSKSSKIKIAKWLKERVNFTLSDEDKAEFDKQEAKAKLKGEAYYELWRKINTEYKEDTDEMIPNHLLWGHAEPRKDKTNKNGVPYYDLYLDKEKTAALRVMRRAYNVSVTKYYEQELLEKQHQFGTNSQEYKDWYDANHVYNPVTHTIEALPCWTKRTIDRSVKGDWSPNYSMRTRNIDDKYKNPNYNKGLNNKENYKIGTGYDNEKDINQFEQEMKVYFKKILSQMAKTPQAIQHFVKEGYLPAEANSELADKPSWLKELAKTFGVVDSNRAVYWDGSTDIGYNTDYIPEMPMSAQLTTKETINPPVREKYKGNEEAYQKALEEYEKNKEEIDKKNQEIHNSLLNRDWVEVMKTFMRQAAHYNAIQDNKYQLLFAQDLLRDIKVYETRPDKHMQLKKNGKLSTDKEIVYKKGTDTQLIEQYNNWLERLIFNHYKQAQGVGEKIGNILQGFTSSSYMTLNIRAGIANVLVGDSNIAGEAWAKEYFGWGHWMTSKALWAHSIMDYIINMYSDKADTKVGAIIKGMLIVDYSELNGRITQIDLKRWSQVVTDLGFSPNNAGEHLMQNGAMLAMMLSHKVIENPNYGQPGEKQYIVVNFEEYAQNVREQILREVATPEQIHDYDVWVANIKKDANGAKNFAWFREDPISKFAADNLDRQQQKEFKAKVKEKRKEMEDSFKKAKTVFDQLDRNENGRMTFAKDSIFEKLNVLEEGQDVSEAYRLLGEFKGRVISVNKKIHGNYGKLDSAQIEKYWLGRLAMQYHKHLPTGILKHYRREGYFNEERGTIEKGMYVSLFDFLAFPVKQMKDRGEISEDEARALHGLQNIFSYVTDYFKYLSIYSDVMPQYERANMRRMLGNIGGMLFALGAVLLLKLGWDDDDEDSRAYNLLLYEMDRLASETFMWNPYGMTSEFRKQWSSPVAAGSIITDSMKIMSTIAGIIFQGSDYDPYYHSGQFAGKHKLAVYFERRIPYYRNYATIRDIADNNKYYKVGDNLLTIVL